MTELERPTREVGRSLLNKTVRLVGAGGAPRL